MGIILNMIDAAIEIKGCYVQGIDAIKRTGSLRKKFVKGGKFISFTVPILHNINFSCRSGERIAFIGSNGSGKSSLLKVIAGIYPLNKGTIKVQGSISTIIEMGLGMESELTGRENIKILMLYNNLLEHYSPALEQYIIEFSELGAAIDRPVKTYSSGMLSRLSFSASLFHNPDILLLDEIFAAGDSQFVEKSLHYMKNKVENIPITILVSHQEDIIRAHCNRCILMKAGQIIKDGSTDEILTIYNQGNY